MLLLEITQDLDSTPCQGSWFVSSSLLRTKTQFWAISKYTQKRPGEAQSEGEMAHANVTPPKEKGMTTPPPPGGQQRFFSSMPCGSCTACGPSPLSPLSPSLSLSLGTSFCVLCSVRLSVSESEERGDSLTHYNQNSCLPSPQLNNSQPHRTDYCVEII